MNQSLNDSFVMICHARSHKSFSNMWVVLHLIMVDVVGVVDGRSASQVDKSLADGVVDWMVRRMNGSSSFTAIVGVASGFMSLVDGGAGGHIGKGGKGVHRSYCLFNLCGGLLCRSWFFNFVRRLTRQLRFYKGSFPRDGAKEDRCQPNPKPSQSDPKTSTNDERAFFVLLLLSYFRLGEHSQLSCCSRCIFASLSAANERARPRVEGVEGVVVATAGTLSCRIVCTYLVLRMCV
jgi:hypothetical protein